MAKSYSMHAVQHTADRAVQLTRLVLAELAPGGLVHDVQADPRFQPLGVDLLWQPPDAPLRGVEVKGDRYHGGGNYFFEVVSNFERNTPGCFLYTQADTLAYAFVHTQEVHLLPVAPLRAWFLAHAEAFPIQHTRTQLGPRHYTTLGALVARERVLREVGGCERHRVHEDGRVVLEPAV